MSELNPFLENQNVKTLSIRCSVKLRYHAIFMVVFSPVIFLKMPTYASLIAIAEENLLDVVRRKVVKVLCVSLISKKRRIEVLLFPKKEKIICAFNQGTTTLN